jgi:two-component system response regulator DegU
MTLMVFFQGVGMAEQISVVIADNHRLIREGLSLILQHEESIRIIGEAVNVVQTINVVKELKPDVVLLDIRMPETDGIQVIPSIRNKSPKTKALMLTSTMDEEKIFKSLKVGAKGYLSMDSSASDLTKAIKAVYRGELWVERKLMSKFFENEASNNSNGANPHKKTHEGLTLREQEVLRHLADGLSNKEIAEDLFISEKTVKSHLNSIFKKLNVTRRLQAILYAINKGLS